MAWSMNNPSIDQIAMMYFKAQAKGKPGKSNNDPDDLEDFGRIVQRHNQAAAQGDATKALKKRLAKGV